ncbi:hypothetical protein E1298_39760 [Actinomadura rubrisoli]|uniref:Uncharacterized protein n=1 Tax=Actinomadura rubrisoli TaxID=2530368 RepID=A0A4R5A551_9ACTN|nr:hypothetical protein E1298_39760 [Actinomadura rubrisoli]
MLTGSAREISKATLVQLQLPRPATGQAMIKSAYVRRLGLRPGEAEAVRDHLRDTGTAGSPAGSGDSAAGGEGPAGEVSDELIGLLAEFERPVPSSLLPSPSEFAPVPVPALEAFGDALIELRQRRVERLAAGRAGAAADTAADPAADVPPADVEGLAQQDVRSAVVAVRALAANTQATPLGMLNLERLEMVPAGLERGELLATIPLAPLEETAVSHKEWSVRSKEFTSIVTDSLETVSETGVTDNTELAQSTTSQAQHSNQFNVTATVTGGIPVINGSAQSGFTSQDSRSQSASDSTKHATALTKKASSRAKQEHKITISTTTVTGTEETSTRKLRNPSASEPMRVDYFSLMRRWRVRLYRHGLRMTYDLVIPEPGAGLRRMHKELADLKGRLGPFQFALPHSEITEAILPGETQPHYRVLAERYGAVVPDPPLPPSAPQFSVGAPSQEEGWHIFTPDPLEVPAGYRIKTLKLWFATTSKKDEKFSFKVLGTPLYIKDETQGEYGPAELTSGAYGKFMLHATGKVYISFEMVNNRNTTIRVASEIEEIPTQLDPDPAKPPKSDRIREKWQSDVWNLLRDAAQSQYYERQQDIATKAAALQEQIEQVDTLTLRREEGDEIMKGVLRFLLGPDFALMPQPVIDAFIKAKVDLEHGIGFDDNNLGLDATAWATVRGHEDVIRFINQAIEWENVVTFLYSYFWDVPQSWNFIRRLRHPDANRQAFLRSGSARVVLTVRKGWEEEWVNFAEGGFKTPPVTPNAKYLTIAREIAAYDDRNYPGIPPANPARSAVRLEEAVYTTSRDVLAKSSNPVNIKVDSSKDFLVGAQVVLDSADKVDPADGRVVQETQIVTAIPDVTHLTVGRLDRAHDGSVTPFAVLQPGTKGALIAEWNEYTPSSGTDIEIGSDLGSGA